MKKKIKFSKWYILYAIALALLPVLLLFTTQLESPSDLLSPPSLSGTNLEIEQAFKNVMGKNDYVLQYPSGGEYRSAYIIKDIDFDGADEAIVFYSLKSDETLVRVNILDKINDKWESVYDEPGYGAKILSVAFEDLNDDDKLEIISCWSLFESKTSKTLTIHEIICNNYRPVEFETLVNQSYTFADVADMDSDGLNEVFVTWIDSTTDKNNPKTYASILKQDKDGTISQIGQNIILDSSISSYSSLKLEKNTEGKAIAYLDAYKGEDAMITEVIWWDEKQKSLVAPLVDTETLTNKLTLRTPAVKSADIDGDGEIEIPINIETNGETYAKETQSTLFAWTYPEGDYLEPVCYGYINTTLGCFFQLPADYEDNIIAYRLSTDAVTTFYWTDDGVIRGDPLFTIVVKDASKLTKNDDYTFKVYHSNMVIYGTLTSLGAELGFTDDMIEKSFIFYDD